MKQTDPQFKLRIPEELRDRVMAAAKTNKRSATAEIIARLEESFLAQDLLAMGEMNAEIQEAMDVIDAFNETTPEQIEGQRDKLLTESIYLEQQLCMNKLTIKTLMERLQHVDDGQRGQITQELMLLRAKTEQLQVSMLEVTEQLKSY